MSDYQEPANHCGRYIMYPSFGDVVLPAPEDPHPNAPPGVTVRPSVCKDYYAARDPRAITDSCRACIYTEYDVSRAPIDGTVPTKNTCICNLERDFLPDDFCNYAQCVQAQNRINGSCARPYAAIFNVDDVRDADYLPPFDYNQLQYCLSRAPAQDSRRYVPRGYGYY